MGKSGFASGKLHTNQPFLSWKKLQRPRLKGVLPKVEARVVSTRSRWQAVVVLEIPALSRPGRLRLGTSRTPFKYPFLLGNPS
jgi:hypothetical protein